MLVSLATLATASALPFAAIKLVPKPLSFDFSISRNFGPDSKFWNIDFFQKLGLQLIEKRYDSALLSNHNNVNYWLDIYLGPESEKITVSLDTGLADLWVYGPNVLSTTGGTFDPEEAGSTPVNNSFSIAYLDGTNAKGEYFLDDFSFSQLEGLLKDLQFAVVESAKFSGPGILGVASKAVESTNEKYDNLPEALKVAGVTPEASYSLYLGSESGTIIFGGIDKNKYEGELVKYPIPKGVEALSLDVVSLSINGTDYNETTSYLLDSGTSWNLWPQQVYNDTIEALSATPEKDYYVADCNQPSDKYLEFNFGKNVIKLSYKDILVKWGETCIVGAQPSQRNFILGDVFLRQAYVYYDLTNKEISVAQFKDSVTSNIVSA